MRGLSFEPRVKVPIRYKGTNLETELEMDIYFPGELLCASVSLWFKLFALTNGSKRCLLS